jgi:predicted CoA-substrate-specific enzyme activase
MNDKCAAGTGRFLEVMARALGVRVEELSELSAGAAGMAKISSMCTVFAESEVISLLSRATPRADIARGLHEAIAERITTLAKRLDKAEQVAMTGGVALNRGVVSAVANRLDRDIAVPAHPQLVGALGAALVAMKS